jgi:hypothetical protein
MPHEAVANVPVDFAEGHPRIPEPEVVRPAVQLPVDSPVSLAHPRREGYAKDLNRPTSSATPLLSSLPWQKRSGRHVPSRAQFTFISFRINDGSGSLASRCITLKSQ